MRLAALLIAILAVQWKAVAQSVDYPHPVDEQSARKNMLEHPEPIYSAIAKGAQVQGGVEIAVTIDRTGKVDSEKACKALGF